MSQPRLLRALAFLAPHRGSILAILGLALLGAAASAAEPLVLKHVFDALGSGDARGALIAGLGLLALVGLGREGVTAVQNWLTWKTRMAVQYDLSECTVGRLHRLPLTFHQGEGVGAVMTRLDRGIQGFVGAVSEIAFNVLPALVYLAIAVGIMARLDVRLAITVLVFAPVPALIASRAAPRQIRREHQLLERWTRIYARFNEVLSGIVVVKSFAMEEAEKKRFLTGVSEANRIVARGVAMDSGVGAAQNLAVLGARLAALAVGGLLVARGEATAGTLVAFLGYVGGLFGPVQGLTGIYRTLRTAKVSLDQVFGILDAQDSLGDAPDAVEPGPLAGAVSFERVHFSYPRKGAPLLDGIDLEIRAGENVAIVGPSGAGKSTLMALLQRFHDPTEGRVLVDGVDVRRFKQSSLRRHIGVVFQDSLLFNESVRDNVAYGRPGASQREIEAAARAAHAHDFVLALPQGYDTTVGERGALLSAGERQRLAIARALLKDPEILVLDEPTSALDAESEALVQAALDRLVKGRTTLSIAHRLSTVVAADRIVVLRAGRIEEQGTHAELLARGGYYASLVRRQTQGLLAA